MNIFTKQAQITIRQINNYICLEGVQSYTKKSASYPELKRKIYLNSVNPLTPVEILNTKWNKCNETDEITYESVRL